MDACVQNHARMISDHGLENDGWIKLVRKVFR